MSESLLETLKRRLFYKTVARYYHNEQNEAVTLHRHRITQNTRRIWWRGDVGEETLEADTDS